MTWTRRLLSFKKPKGSEHQKTNELERRYIVACFARCKEIESRKHYDSKGIASANKIVAFASWALTYEHDMDLGQLKALYKEIALREISLTGTAWN